MSNQFKMEIDSFLTGIFSGGFDDIDAFGTTITLNTGDMAGPDTSSSDVYAVIRDIEKQASSQMKIIGKLAKLKIHPSNPKAPKRFLGIGWRPDPKKETWFPEIQKKPLPPGKDPSRSLIRFRIDVGSLYTFEISGVRVLAVRKEPRLPAQLVQFEFDEMSPVKL